MCSYKHVLFDIIQRIMSYPFAYWCNVCCSQNINNTRCLESEIKNTCIYIQIARSPNGYIFSLVFNTVFLMFSSCTLRILPGSAWVAFCNIFHLCCCCIILSCYTGLKTNKHTKLYKVMPRPAGVARELLEYLWLQFKYFACVCCAVFKVLRCVWSKRCCLWRAVQLLFVVCWHSWYLYLAICQISSR